MRRIAEWSRAHVPALGLSFLLALVAAGVFWFFAFFVSSERQAAIGGWRQQLSQRADNRRDILDGWISARVDDARFIATFSSVRAILSSSRRPATGEGSAPHVSEILSDARSLWSY